MLQDTGSTPGPAALCPVLLSWSSTERSGDNIVQGKMDIFFLSLFSFWSS